MSKFYGKRIFREYNTLQNWLSENDRDERKAKVEDFSSEPTVAAPTEEKLNATASSTPNTPQASCSMIIYPSTSVFMGYGLRIEMRIPYTYPYAPPAVFMKSAISHPNIGANGQICIAKLELTRTWQPTPLSGVLMSIIELMDQPDIDHAIDADMAKLHSTNHAEYVERMQKSVRQHGVQRA